MEGLAPTILIIGAIVSAVLWFANSSKKSRIDELEKSAEHTKTQYAQEKQKYILKNVELSEVNRELRAKNKQLSETEKNLLQLIAEKSKQFPWLAMAFADYQQYLGLMAEATLRNKKRPAPKAADDVRKFTRRAVDAERKFRTLKYRLDFYEKYFPWITEVTGDTLEELLEQQGVDKTSGNEDSKEDPVRQYLSTPEYEALSTTDRHQLALDRWRQNHKSNWEIGRMYERFVGYEYEQQGFRVEYFGAIKGFDDLGRDLIVSKGGDIRIVQCKYWSKNKTIHEKHIFQLFGTVVEYIARSNAKDDTLPLFGTFERLADIRPVFVTSTSLSEKARDFANLLEVEVREGIGLGDYPMIKCNISKRDGERVYHLPFDQQYDRTVIEPEDGEFYAWTTKEAEERGFRRAYRWRPEGGD